MPLPCMSRSNIAQKHTYCALGVISLRSPCVCVCVCVLSSVRRHVGQTMLSLFAPMSTDGYLLDLERGPGRAGADRAGRELVGFTKQQSAKFISSETLGSAVAPYLRPVLRTSLVESRLSRAVPPTPLQPHGPCSPTRPVTRPRVPCIAELIPCTRTRTPRQSRRNRLCPVN